MVSYLQEYKVNLHIQHSIGREMQHCAVLYRKRCSVWLTGDISTSIILSIIVGKHEVARFPCPVQQCAYKIHTCHHALLPTVALSPPSHRSLIHTRQHSHLSPRNPPILVPNRAGTMSNSTPTISNTIAETNKMRVAIGLPPLRIPPKNALSASIELTNRMRKAAGLKPLRTTPVQREVQEVKEVKENDGGDVMKRVKEARENRLRQSVIAPRSIAEQAQDELPDDASDWVKRTLKRPIDGEGSPAKKRRHVRGEDASVEVEKSARDLSEGHTDVLTLRDAHVADEESDLLEKRVANLRKEEEETINGLVYDGTDNAQFTDARPTPTGTQSAAATVPVTESDFKPAKAFKPRKRPRKQRRALKPVVKGRMAELRAEADKNISEEDEEDEHYSELRRAKRKVMERRKQRGIAQIYQAVHDEEEEASDGGSAMEIEGTASEEEDQEEEIVRDVGKVMQKAGDSGSRVDRKVRFANGGVKKESSEDVKEALAETNPEDTADDKVPENFALPSKQPIEEGVDTNGMTGLAATLSRLRSRGQLSYKAPKKGRRRDKRVGTTNDEAGDETDIKLSYLDDDGNELTQKEAFRMLSHKFHGNGPGKNKREKKLRQKLEANARGNQKFKMDDTPLSSLAALKEETKKLGTAHVVLSGADAVKAATEKDALKKGKKKKKKA